MSKPTENETELRADKELREKIEYINRFPDNIDVKNLVLTTVEDIIELVYEIAPYSMKKLDEAHSVIQNKLEGLN